MLLLTDDGALFAVVGGVEDACVHVWDNAACVECASLAHPAPVVSAAWEPGDGDPALVALCDNGVVMRWTKQVRAPAPSRREIG
jgi:hypothetical protein